MRSPSVRERVGWVQAVLVAIGKSCSGLPGKLSEHNLTDNVV